MKTGESVASKRTPRATGASAFAVAYWFGFFYAPPASLVGREVP